MKGIVERIRGWLRIVYNAVRGTRKASEELPGAPPEDSEQAGR